MCVHVRVRVACACVRACVRVQYLCGNVYMTVCLSYGIIMIRKKVQLVSIPSLPLSSLPSPVISLPSTLPSIYLPSPLSNSLPSFPSLLPLPSLLPSVCPVQRGSVTSEGPQQHGEAEEKRESCKQMITMWSPGSVNSAYKLACAALTLTS